MSGLQLPSLLDARSDGVGSRRAKALRLAVVHRLPADGRLRIRRPLRPRRFDAHGGSGHGVGLRRAERRLRRQHRQRAECPAHDAPGRPRLSSRTRSRQASRPGSSRARSTSAMRRRSRPTTTPSRRTPKSPIARAAMPSRARWPARPSCPGSTRIAGAVSNTGTATFDGQSDPNAVFVFQVNGALAMAAASHVVLINGARASRVFWQVNRCRRHRRERQLRGNADGARRGRSGRTGAWSTAVRSHSTAPSRSTPTSSTALRPWSPSPVGPRAITTDTTPTISGTTDVEAPALVTVTSTGRPSPPPPRPARGRSPPRSWRTPVYPVVASVTDGAGNPGSATQHADRRHGAADRHPRRRIVRDDERPDPDDRRHQRRRARHDRPRDRRSQTLTALVQTAGTWNITPVALTDGTRVVTVSVTDPAGNLGTASQGLTVDTAAPAADDRRAERTR